MPAVRRLTAYGWTMIAMLVGAVAVWPLSEGVSLALGFCGGIMALSAIGQALGDTGAGSLENVAKGKRTALRGLFPGRDWDRKAPDFADEPIDAIWQRERRRRGLAR